MSADIVEFKRKGAKRPRAATRSTNRVWIRITDEERAELDIVASENGCSITALIRDSINSFVADYRDGEPVFVQRCKHPRCAKASKAA